MAVYNALIRSTPALSIALRVSGDGSLPTAAWGRAGHRRTVRLHADGVDHRVRATPVGQVLELLRHAVLGGIQRFNAVTLGHGATLGHCIRRDHPVAQVLADPGGHLPDRAQTQHRQRAAVGDRRVVHGLPGGGHDVGKKQVALVFADVGNLDRPVVRVRHAQVLRLPAGHRAVKPRVTEELRAGPVFADLGGFTLRLQSLAAHEAMPAGNVEGDDHPIPRLDVSDGRADLFDDAHGLMADDVALVHERCQHLIEVQVRSADGGRGDPDDRIGGFLDLWVRDLLHAHRV
nr:hypothetical protein [Flaviflexus massiliensis]